MQLLLRWFQFPSSRAGRRWILRLAVCPKHSLCAGLFPVEWEWKGPGLNGGLWVGLGWLEAGLRFCPSLGQRRVAKLSTPIPRSIVP